MDYCMEFGLGLGFLLLFLGLGFGSGGNICGYWKEIIYEF
jgi:hypothetical protein